MLNAQNIALPPRLMPLSIQVKPGEILHVIGPNGSGKSTMISCLSGLISCAGDIELDGRALNSFSLDALAFKRCYLSQQDRPAFSVTVYHYLHLSVLNPNVDSELLSQVVAHITNVLGITDKLNRTIHQLSGGEWQRVRLAGACLQVWPTLNPDSRWLLLDEPAAALDIGQEAMMYQLIRDVARMGIGVVVANHDLNRTLNEADNVLLLKQGICLGVGEPDEIMTEERLSEVFNTSVKKVQVEGRPYLIFDRSI